MIGARDTLDSKKEENSREYTFAEHFTAFLFIRLPVNPKISVSSWGPRCLGSYEFFLLLFTSQ
jgi:hypothetical protein